MPEEKVVIVSRHPATVNLLKSRFPEAEVVSHMTEDNIPENALVIGNLPIEMIAKVLEKGNRFVSVVLNIPPEMRGKELSEEELKKFAKFVEVKKLELEV